jgi:hypothetical protein
MLTRSTTKIIRKYNEEDSNLKYATNLKIVCDWVNTWVLAVVAGRGAAKSSEIQAQRIISVVEDMPGAPLAFICDTYVNLRTNILPAVKMGMKRKDWHEGVHYVSNQRPPEEWLRKCTVIIDDFSHTMFFYNGTVIFGGSLDRPSLLAGKSVCHLFIDEAKFQDGKKVDRVFPILRGDSTMYGYSTYFLGMTITTDMPDVTGGEFDWIFRFSDKVNDERIRLIINTYGELNKLKLKYYNEYNGKARDKELEKILKDINRWEYLLRKARHEQTFFLNASSLSNIQVLTLKYLTGLTQTLEPHEFNKSVLGMRPTLKRELRFYSNIQSKHFYDDGINYAFADKVGYDKQKIDCRWLRYHDPNLKLEGGFDTGNMKSLIIAQDFQTQYRLLKFFYTLPPDSFQVLGEQFVRFFKTHINKELDLYYDRAANSGSAMGEDAANNLKNAIEKDREGNRTGWLVNLKSLKQPNIPQELEYEFMLKVFNEDIPGLPIIRIDSEMCKQVKSSLEKAKANVKYDSKGKKKITKDKKSEKLEASRLPMESTNPSDAFKYLVCRYAWLSIANPRKRSAILSLSTKSR